MIKSSFLIKSCLLIMMVAFSCQQNQSYIDVPENPILKGITEPILIDSERTIIPMGGYVSDPFRVDSVTTDGPFIMEIDNSNIILFGRPERSLYSMTFWNGGIGESIILRPVKKSLHSFLYTGNANGVKIRGDFNEWNVNNTIMERNRNSFSTYLLLSPGRYEYQFVVDSREMTDPFNKDSIRNEVGSWNSVLTISDKNIDQLPQMELSSLIGNSINIEISTLPQKHYVFWQNTRLPDKYVKIEFPAIKIELPANAMEMEESELRVWIENERLISDYLDIPLHFGEVTITK